MAPSDPLIRPARLAKLLSVSKVTLWRMRKRGELPEPIRISAGAVGWRRSVIEAWLARRESEAIAIDPRKVGRKLKEVSE